LCDRVLIINRGTIIVSGSIADVRSRWNQRNYDVYRITYRGPHLSELPAGDADAGIFEVTDEPAAAGEVSLVLRRGKDGRALSRVLDAILRTGGTVLRCDLQEVPFDEVFCSLVLGDQAATPAAEVARV